MLPGQKIGGPKGPFSCRKLMPHKARPLTTTRGQLTPKARPQQLRLPLRRSEPVKAPTGTPFHGALATRPYGRFETLINLAFCVWISSSAPSRKRDRPHSLDYQGGNMENMSIFTRTTKPNAKRKSMCGIGQKNPRTDKRRVTHKNRRQHENLGSAGNTNGNRPRKPLLARNDSNRNANNEIGPKGPKGTWQPSGRRQRRTRTPASGKAPFRLAYPNHRWLWAIRPHLGSAFASSGETPEDYRCSPFALA